MYIFIDKGFYFGDLDFIFVNSRGEMDGKRKFTAKALEDCDLLVLSKQDLQSADREFEDVVNELF